MTLILIIIVGLMWANIGSIYSKIVNQKIPYLGFMTFSLLGSVSSAWILLPNYKLIANEGLPELGNMPLIMIFSGLLTILGFKSMNYAMSIGHHSATWSIGQSALVMPFLFGVYYFKDIVNTFNIVGVVLIIISTISLSIAGKGNSNSDNESSKKNNNYLLWLVMAFLSMILLGTQQIAFSIPSYWTDWNDVANLRIPILQTSILIFCIVLNLTTENKWNVLRYWKSAMWLCVLGTGASAILMISIDRLNLINKSAIAFPIAVGICNVAFSIYSSFILKEETNRFHIAGMIIGSLGIIGMAIQ